MSRQQAIKSVSFLWMGSLLGSGSTFIICMILARELGVEQFGVFSSVLAILTVFSLFAGFGLPQSWLKHFGLEGWNAIRWIAPSFKLVLISISAVLFILIMWGFFGYHDNTTRVALIVMSSFIVGQTVIELVSIKLQLEEEYLKLALWQLLPNFLRLILIASTVYIFSKSISVMYVAYIYSSVAFLFIVIGVYQLIKMSENLHLKGHGKKIINYIEAPSIKKVLEHSWAFGLGGIFAFIYIQSDIIMVKYISGDEQAGLYNVAFVIMTAILILPTVLYQKFLMPKAHRLANSDKNKFYNSYRKGNTAMLLLSTLVLASVYFLSDFFIPLLFGKEYIYSAYLAKILFISLPFHFIAYNIGITLVTREHMKQKVKLMGLVTVVNIILNLLLIPNYQALGASVATILSSFLLVLLYYIYAERYVFNI